MRQRIMEFVAPLAAIAVFAAAGMVLVISVGRP